MSAQLFFARYPTGNLISELIEIYQGKFVVRAALQIEGVTRATGLAAAATIEAAEDTARNRALMIFGIQSATTPDTTTAGSVTRLQHPNQSVPAENFSSTPTLPLPDTQRVPLTSTPETVVDENSGFEPSTSNTPQAAWNPTAPSPPNHLSLVNPQFEEDEDDTASISPVDLSDALLKIDVTLKRLGWSADHEKDYLERTYNKRSRQFLTDTEVLEFQRYLEALAKTGDEMKRLKWSTQQGKDYLLRTYNKRTRALLTYEELLEFLQYLESQPSMQPTHS